ncbi:MAG: carbohydrate ABC transporter permease [Chloroflexota bacterium]
MATAEPIEKSVGKVDTIKQWWRLLLRVRKEGWGNPVGYLFIAPGIILFLIFQVWPLINGFTMAFTDFAFLKQLKEPTNFVGLANFVEFFTNDKFFWPSFERSLKFTAIYLPIMLTLGLFLATVIARIRNSRVAGFFRMSMYLPVILPIAVAVLLWTTLLSNDFGYVNAILKSVGLKQFAISWLNNKNVVIPVVALIRIWRDAGGVAILFLIGMYGINEELYESASLDGAGAFQQWRYITMPLLRPTLVLVLVLNVAVLSAAHEFMIIYGVPNLGPEGEGLTLGYYIWLVSFWWPPMRFGYGAAMSLFMGTISAIMSFIVFKLLRTERA